MFNVDGSLKHRFGASDAASSHADGDAGRAPRVISDVAVSPETDNVLVADHRLRLFDRHGTFLREMGGGSSVCRRGRYGGVCFDPRGLVLATRSQPGSSVVQVCFCYRDRCVCVSMTGVLVSV